MFALCGQGTRQQRKTMAPDRAILVPCGEGALPDQAMSIARDDVIDAHSA